VEGSALRGMGNMFTATRIGKSLVHKLFEEIKLKVMEERGQTLAEDVA